MLDLRWLISHEKVVARVPRYLRDLYGRRLRLCPNLDPSPTRPTAACDFCSIVSRWRTISCNCFRSGNYLDQCLCNYAIRVSALPRSSNRFVGRCEHSGWHKNCWRIRLYFHEYGDHLGSNQLTAISLAFLYKFGGRHKVSCRHLRRPNLHVNQYRYNMANKLNTG